MLFQVAFSVVEGACVSKPKEVETVTLHGSQVNGSFFCQVVRIIDRRETVHPLVRKWAEATACELRKVKLGLTVVVYKAAQHPYTGKVERCGSWVYRQKS